MIRISRRAALGIGTTFATGIGARCLFAQANPIRGPITLVVPFAAGGATDIVSRLVAKRLSELIGQSVIVENVAGAGGITGATRIARGAPDGSVLLMGTVSTHAINPLMAAKPPYDPLSDFTPVSLVAVVPNVIVVSQKTPAKDIQGLIAWLKTEPGKHTYGSSGNGTPPHLSGELFKSMAGVSMTHVPYRGGGPAMTDLVGGQIPILFDVLSGAAGFIRDSAVRALGITTKVRSPSFPDLPTVAEQGLANYETYTWNAVFAPPGMPEAMSRYLSARFKEAVDDAEIQKRLRELSADPIGSTPEQLTEQVKSEMAKWRPVIESVGLKQN
ncbi:tripartite tricarboxylate transporter family receptor [Variibacter gotjawalensis]|uniref:Tripartite tricarboxylate transporter family receptor n=1 Tax=Variibacter gotjawalensis TaxID=1333996 RepID=A0A0S3PUE4_9BRAD|nr:tripartite tricarboxylate transporter substrate binding protein [Variibacter gotjawalensis]NIK49760.1 tripartite-type tricarboxylate transporter receptor subunit TctC [Variibacter gotjawalensis]RZS45765.1 tripartite-type tricarboxylate transporter receptor subunit TctC [Variibacter gotjawalensis]BAT59438.1 tripartite tricarboxylate transporter family receptor [Variibacter gotjawalensis]